MKKKSSVKRAILLGAYGTPNSIAEVAPYLTDIRRGPPRAELLREIEERYRAVGGKTPLLEITKKQADFLEKLLVKARGGDASRVYIGMKHWHPYIKDTIKKMIDDGIGEILFIALAPHYSKISIGGYEKAIEDALQSLSSNIKVTYVKTWHDNKFLVDCIVEQTREALGNFKDAENPKIIFTAHSLPSRIKEWGDPYERELLETSKLIAGKLGYERWTFSFQSAGATADPWLGPDVLETLKRLAGEGEKKVLVCPIGFVSDHLEILFDIDIECQAFAKQLGVELRRVESRNTHPLFIQALKSIVEMNGF